MTTNTAELATALVANPPAIPIAIQITAMIITALTPLILGGAMWLQNNKLAKVAAVTDATHTIVNSQRTEMLASIKKLEDESEVLAAETAGAVMEKRMAEMIMANQVAMREVFIEAAKAKT